MSKVAKYVVLTDNPAGSCFVTGDIIVPSESGKEDFNDYVGRVAGENEQNRFLIISNSLRRGIVLELAEAHEIKPFGYDGHVEVEEAASVGDIVENLDGTYFSVIEVDLKDDNCRLYTQEIGAFDHHLWSNTSRADLHCPDDPVSPLVRLYKRS